MRFMTLISGDGTTEYQSFIEVYKEELDVIVEALTRERERLQSTSKRPSKRKKLIASMIETLEIVPLSAKRYDR